MAGEPEFFTPPPNSDLSAFLVTGSNQGSSMPASVTVSLSGTPWPSTGHSLGASALPSSSDGGLFDCVNYTTPPIGGRNNRTHADRAATPLQNVEAGSFTNHINTPCMIPTRDTHLEENYVVTEQVHTATSRAASASPENRFDSMASENGLVRQWNPSTSHPSASIRSDTKSLKGSSAVLTERLPSPDHQSLPPLEPINLDTHAPPSIHRGVFSPSMSPFGKQLNEIGQSNRPSPSLLQQKGPVPGPPHALG